MSDESYDPHARMHDSFPRVDSGSLSSRIDDAISQTQGPWKPHDVEKAGKLIDLGLFNRHEGSFPPSKDYNDVR